MDQDAIRRIVQDAIDNADMAGLARLVCNAASRAAAKGEKETARIVLDILPKAVKDEVNFGVANGIKRR